MHLWWKQIEVLHISNSKNRLKPNVFILIFSKHILEYHSRNCFCGHNTCFLFPNIQQQQTFLLGASKIPARIKQCVSVTGAKFGLYAEKWRQTSLKSSHMTSMAIFFVQYLTHGQNYLFGKSALGMTFSST